jgi:hypothetical protein
VKYHAADDEAAARQRRTTSESGSDRIAKKDGVGTERRRGLEAMRAALVLVLALTACVGLPMPEVLKGPVVGYTTRSWRDPVTGRPLRVVLFYPPLRPLVQAPTRMGPWWVEAGSTEAIAFGRHPLVVISHGEAGSRFGHHDLARSPRVPPTRQSPARLSTTGGPRPSSSHLPLSIGERRAPHPAPGSAV